MCEGPPPPPSLRVNSDNRPEKRAAGGEGSGGGNPEIPPEVRKFREAVKEAEKATLIFNLDLGSVPILNQDTMSKRSTMALSAMAAAVEGRQASAPSGDAMAALEDVISVTKSVSFFGATTKTYRNTKDPKSGAFCTVPVKYGYKDKDTRIRAETILRKRCNVNCSTPYPTILRDCIRKTIEAGKLARPDDFVRVHVDANNFGLKLAWRPRDSTKWIPHDNLIPLPQEALDVSSRKAPEGICRAGLPPPRARQSTPPPASPKSITMRSDNKTGRQSPSRQSPSGP